MALVAASSVGCYHAGGLQRQDTVAEEIPAVSGDRVGGFKADAVAGDYYLGNDYIHLTVDGTPFGTKSGAAGAAGGGSILDLGSVSMDQNYLRTSPPSDRLERMTLVVNQDPDIQFAVDTFLPTTKASTANLIMKGGLYDPKHKIASATHDASGRVSGVDVTHAIALGNTLSYFAVVSQLTNNCAVPLEIYNLGDHVHQTGGGYRFNIPANKDAVGNLVNNWGVDIPDSGPGTVFGAPAATVQARMAALMSCEPGGNMDYHTSIGLVPLMSDDAPFYVTSSPQSVFTNPRPVASENLVLGSKPNMDSSNALVKLQPGESLIFNRRIYFSSGKSTTFGRGYFGQSTGRPNQATGVFNAMAVDRHLAYGEYFGTAYFQPEGSAEADGPLQTEIRIERYTNADVIAKLKDPTDKATYDAGLAAFKADNTNWILERTEWLEPTQDFDSSSANIARRDFLGVVLPSENYYRISFRNRDHLTSVAPPWIYCNNVSTTHPDIATPLKIEDSSVFAISSKSHLCPEYNEILNGDTIVKSLFQSFTVSARTANPPNQVVAWQPLRLNVLGQNGTPDPNMPRVSTMDGYFNPAYKAKTLTNLHPGYYTFTGGNQSFATNFQTNLWLAPGSYSLLASNGPLTSVTTDKVSFQQGEGVGSKSFVLYHDPLPPGWTSFDMPGPSQITTGGYLPAEKLSSAVVEGVQVVANTEIDRLTDADYLYYEFRIEFDYNGTTDYERIQVQKNPFVVGARSSSLAGLGTVTALFTPTPSNDRNGGARSSTGWNLADFIGLAQGQFTVVHRPRGAEGLFTLQGFDPAQPVSSQAWWNAKGAYVSDRTQGAFDAIELLRGEGWDSANPDAWFGEFKTLRNDWFALLKQQTPTNFTKALGLSSAKFSVDTPVGFARTYLKAQGYNNEFSGATDYTDGFTQSDLSPVLTALKKGAAVASTGPLVDVKLSTSSASAGSGELLAANGAAVTLTVNLWAATDWVPVDELRVVINGVTTVLDVNQLQSLPTTDPDYDWRLRRGTFTLTLPSKDAWVVVEAGVPLDTTGTYMAGSTWNGVMHGLYPVAVANPIFVDVDGGGYTAPGL